MNRKGVESFPFFLFLTILIAVVILTISFYQLQLFSDFSGKKQMADGYQQIVSAMNNLRSTADKGSFTRVNLKIPNNGNITISPTANTMTIVISGQTIVNTPDVNLTNVTDGAKNIVSSLTLSNGDYEVVVYYGEPTSQVEPYEIFFI